MKKYRSGIVVVLSALLLSGCQGKDVINEVNLKIVKNMVGDKDSIDQYESLEEQGEIDENGKYKKAEEILAEDESDEAKTDKTDVKDVHVTLASNNNLDITYYYDADMTKEVTGSCYLNKGESLYAKVSSKKDVSQVYQFEKYKIYEYNNGNREEVTLETASDNTVLTIPKDYEGKELSVIPIGNYNEKEITLSDYYMDESDNRCELDGVWLVGDKETKDEIITAQALSSDAVSYTYDNNLYFFVGANPPCRYQDDESGAVVFDKPESNTSNLEYQIELHKYLETEIKSSKEFSYKINDGKDSGKEKTHKITGLRYGDVITLTSKKETTFDYDEKFLKMKDVPTETSKGYEYIFTVKQNNGIRFNPMDYKYDNGDIVFTYHGKKVTDEIYVSEGAKIQYSAENVSEDYRLPDGEHEIIVSDLDTLQKDLKNIRLYKEKDVKIYLPQPKAGGVINYYVDDKEIEEDSITVKAGTVIKIGFESYNGWRCDTGDVTYTATEEDEQEITIDGKNVDNIFKEEDEHKPELELVLNESIEKEDLTFDIKASSYEKSGIKYKSQMLKKNYTYDKIGNIGTDEPVTISIKGGSLDSGKALKVVTTKTGKKGSATVKSTEYIEKLPETLSFNIYDIDDATDKAASYKEVTIKVSLVNINEYAQCEVDNATTTLIYADTKAEVKDGDTIDKNRKVIFTITPDDGYYIVDNKSVSDGIYSKSMTYGEYKKNLEDILTKNEVKPIGTITLDTSDPYGTVTYKIDGKEVSGTVKIKEKQKITMEYTITEDGYKVKNKKYKIRKSDKKKEVTITVSEDDIGTTITRADYIDVVKKGE